MTFLHSVTELDWGGLAANLDEAGYAVTPPLLDPATCLALQAMFDEDARFRSTVDMTSFNFGRGRYRYFANPLPEVVTTLRTELYPPLAQIVNPWAERLDGFRLWPETFAEFTSECHEAGQTRPTPLLLRYRAGDFNCLHQDLYGSIHFPLQAVFMLSDPKNDFDGGELAVVENRPRLMSRVSVIAVQQGACAIIPVRERPRASKRGWSRSQMRHGVSTVRRGERVTLGVIFHDAA